MAENDNAGDVLKGTASEGGLTLEEASALIGKALAQPLLGDSGQTEEQPIVPSVPAVAEAAAEAGEPAELEEQPKYKVKVDGQELEVTLEEALKGYSREADYSRKTMALSERERALKAEADEKVTSVTKAVAAERERYQAALKIWDQNLTAELGDDASLDKLRATDPLGYATAVADRTRKLEALSRIQSEQRRIKDEDDTKKAGELKARQADAAQKLFNAVPEWKDRTKFKSDMDKIVAYAEKIEITPGELNNVLTDYRAFLAFRDAAAFHELSVKKPLPDPSAIRTARPGAAAPSLAAQSTAMKLAKVQANSGDLKSTAALLHAMGLGKT